MLHVDEAMGLEKTLRELDPRVLDEAISCVIEFCIHHESDSPALRRWAWLVSQGQPSLAHLASVHESEETDEIDALYQELRELDLAAASEESETARTGLIARLRELQRVEAANLTARFRARRPLDPDVLERDLRRALDLIARHDDSSTRDTAPGGAS